MAEDNHRELEPIYEKTSYMVFGESLFQYASDIMFFYPPHSRLKILDDILQHHQKKPVNICFQSTFVIIKTFLTCLFPK
jgi:hypothetical protein